MQKRFASAAACVAFLLLLQPAILAQEAAAEKTASGKTTKVQLQAVPVEDGEAKKKKGAGLRVVPAVKAFISTMSDEQKELAMLEYGSEKRVQWHFIPKETRKGFPVMDKYVDCLVGYLLILRDLERTVDLSRWWCVKEYDVRVHR